MSQLEQADEIFATIKDPRDFPWADRVAVLAREIAYRRRVYPNWVAAGRLKQAEADYQLHVLEAIFADLYVWMHGLEGGREAAVAELARRAAAAPDAQPAFV